MATGVGLGNGSAPVIKVYTVAASTPGIPRSVDGFAVVTQAVGPIYAHPNECSGPPWLRPPSCNGGVDPTARFERPVPIGISTGHPDITAGTIGARVTDGTNYYALSNNHVYANENLAAIGDDVLQPGTLDGGSAPVDVIGTLDSFVPIAFNGSANRVDAAIAVTTAADLGDSTPVDGYGTPAATTVAATLGTEVIKYGRTTGQTTGTIDAINAAVNVGYDTGVALFTGQVIISGQGGPFSADGDSGSVIVTSSGHNPVAFLFAGNSWITVGNPIDEVLSEMGVYFEDGSPPTTTTTTTAPPTTTTTTITTTTTTVAPGATMHVGDLNRSSQMRNNGRWNATVTVTLHDENHNPVNAATVDGGWSAGANGSGSCTTDAFGTCSITKKNISGNNATVTFTVTDSTHSHTYDPSENHDPDGDSNGTAVLIFAP